MARENENRVDQHGLLRPEVISTAPSGDPGKPNYALWLFYLYARPRYFFEHFVADHMPGLTALVAWIYGMCGISDTLERGVSGGAIPELSRSWLVYWALLSIGGVLGAALYYKIGGWWYRVRLRWSGVTDPDAAMARRVYLYASLVFAFPVWLHIVWQTLNFARPIDASNSSVFHVFDLAVLLFLVWSIVTSYIGVRTVFGATGFRAALWFLFLPMTVTLIGLGMIFAAVFLYAYSAPAVSPAVSSPIEYRSGDIVFSHPGNWAVDSADPSFEAGVRIPISMEANAALLLEVYESDLTTEEEADATVEQMKQEGTFPEGTSIREFAQWGSYRGAGREVSFSQDGDVIVYRVFVAGWGDGRRLEVFEGFAESDRATLARGYKQVADSLTRRDERVPTGE
jgi:hypothetical protein